jgi:hypothetical protein
MQDYNHSFPPSQNMGGKKQPISLIAQLMQEIVNMHHVDDTFRWLANAMIYHLDIPTVQLWATQRNAYGQSRIEPRTTASQNLSLLQHLSLDQQILSVIYRLLQEQRAVISLPVEQIFSTEQTPLLIQYGWRYWSCYFLYYDALLPPRAGTEAYNVPTPLLMAASFFLRAPFSEKQERAIGYLFEQTLRLLHNRHFLNSAINRPTPVPPTTPAPPISFADIIPQRTQDIEISQANNPFASATILTDKNARRLYSAIDGQKTLSELARSLAFNEQEIRQALRYLFQQGKISLYTRDEQRVDPSFFGNSQP